MSCDKKNARRAARVHYNDLQHSEQRLCGCVATRLLVQIAQGLRGQYLSVWVCV